MSCKNRGKFGRRVGRPSKTMYEALEKKKEICHDPRTSLMEMAEVDIRTVDPDVVSDFDDAVTDDNMNLADWIRSLARQTYNPFIFKCDGLLVKMAGMTRLEQTA